MQKQQQQQVTRKKQSKENWKVKCKNNIKKAAEWKDKYSRENHGMENMMENMMENHVTITKPKKEIIPKNEVILKLWPKKQNKKNKQTNKHARYKVETTWKENTGEW